MTARIATCSGCLETMYGEEALTAGDRSGECIRCWNGHDPADDYARGIDVGKWLTERTNGQPGSWRFGRAPSRLQTCAGCGKAGSRSGCSRRSSVCRDSARQPSR